VFNWNSGDTGAKPSSWCVISKRAVRDGDSSAGALPGTVFKRWCADMQVEELAEAA